MLLEENQITFHSEDGLTFDGVNDYSRQIAEMIGLGSETEFLQAGVSLVSPNPHPPQPPHPPPPPLQKKSNIISSCYSLGTTGF